MTPTGTGAAISGNIVITFSEPMDASTAGMVELSSLPALPGGVWSGSDTEFTIAYSGLAYSTAYTVNISNFKDAAGNTMIVDNSNSFTTIDEPTTSNVPFFDNLLGEYDVNTSIPIKVKGSQADRFTNYRIVRNGQVVASGTIDANTNFTPIQTGSYIVIAHSADEKFTLWKYVTIK